MKIRIFALAKELGIDSKELIEYCNQVGVQLKNSALASISPEERDKVVDYIERGAKSTGTATEEKPLQPTRAAAPELTGKVRAIKTIAPRPQNGRTRSRVESDSGPSTTEAPPEETVADEPEVSEPAVAEETVPTAKTQEEPAPADVSAEEAASEAQSPEVQEEAPAAPEERPETSPTAEETPPAEVESSATGKQDESAPSPSDQAQPDETTSPEKGKKVVPISRDDYVTASGLSPSSIREMKPRGTVSDSETRQGRRGKAKSRSSLPNVAAPPAYKKPKISKPDEAPAQKPDMKLTPDVLEQQSPLAAHLQQQKKKRKSADEEAAEGKDSPKRGGMGLLESRRREKKKLRGVPDEEAPKTAARQRTAPRRRRQRSSAPVALKTSAQIEMPITLRGLSEAMGRPVRDLMRTLMQRGQMVSINENIDEEIALDLAMEMGVDLDIKRGRDIEEELARALDEEDAPETLVTRPPIITILGHVDHGKTTLLDKLRSADVAGGEAGGITQHIAAYQVEHNGHRLTFVDTPGHAAFGEMRARGANVTDIVVLVVAADDGVMPQTVECISHAKSAGVPIVVAMNKIDLPDTNEQRVLQDLTAHDILPSEWGGDTEVVRTSAIEGQGLDDLLETLLVTSELHEFTSNPERPAIGVCLEAFRDEGRGALAWLIVQKGTLRIGDAILCGSTYGRIRAMYNDRDEEIQEAGPSTPVKVAGLGAVPGAGNHFFVMSDIEEAREVAESRQHRGRTEILARRGRPRSLEDILTAARGGTVQDLAVILKADTPGSIEALRSEINKFEHPEVRVNIIHEGVGGVNESDVYLASASGAIIVAFHVIAEDRAQVLAEREGVDVRRYNIIYEVIDEIKQVLEGLLKPERVQVSTGRALVMQTFSISRFGTIAGCRVLSGTIDRSNRVHVIRDQKVLNDYNIASLKREKEDVKEVREGMECGIRLEGFNDVKEGDLLEAYRVEEVKRTLE